MLIARFVTRGGSHSGTLRGSSRVRHETEGTEGSAPARADANGAAAPLFVTNYVLSLRTSAYTYADAAAAAESRRRLFS